MNFRLWQFPNAVQELSLDFNSNARSLDEEISAAACVQDGLGILGNWADIAARIGSGLDESRDMPHCADLLDPAVVRNLQLPNEQCARIQQKTLAINFNLRSLPTSIRAAAVHAPEHLHDEAAKVKDGGRLFTLNSAIGGLVTQISELPHMQASLDIAGLQDSERRGFLYEAEALRHIPADRAELIAVFRRVPIEMISRLRFLAEKKIILYCMCGEPRRTHARLHDIAAVRDIGNGEIHLIPHRTQFRSVTLK